MHTGSQAGRATGIIAGIIAGSIAGGLIILLLLVAIVSTMVYLVLKRKILSANAKDNCNTSLEKSKVDDIVTNINPAYMSIQRQRATANHEFEVVCDTNIPDIGETTMELQESNESRNSKLIMERDVAYEASTTVQISLHLNVAYYESRKAFINVNHQANDEDYI